VSLSLRKEKSHEERRDLSIRHLLKKSQPEEFDLVILGGGTGSTIAAWTFASEGKRVAVVDRKYIGGSCPNIACLPSKNIIHSVKVVGLLSPKPKSLVLLTMASRLRCRASETARQDGCRSERDVSGELPERPVPSSFWAPDGSLVRELWSRFLDGSTRQLRGTNVIISTGTRAALGAIAGFAEAQPLTHIEALELDKVPEHLLVIGGGYVGIELSQAMRRFAAKCL